MNSGFFDPSEKLFMLHAQVEDITISSDGNDKVLISVSKFTGGIEVIHDGDKLWWPA